MSSKTRLNLQNQDLINTYNSLTHENKYYQNIMKTYQDTIDEEDDNVVIESQEKQRIPRNFITGISDNLKKNSVNKLNQTVTGKFYRNSR